VITFATKRLFALIPTLLGVAMVTFLLVLLIPGDPSDVLLPPGTPAAARQAFQKEFRLNGSVDERFGAWLTHAVRGDFGESVARYEPARAVVARALGKTSELAVAAILISVLAGVTLGIAMGWWADRLIGRILSVLVISLASIPQFLLGLLLLYFLAVKAPIFPTGGAGPLAGGDGFGTDLRYLALPAITVAILPMAIIARMTRTLFLELKQRDFVLTLQTRGYSALRIWRHLLRNAAPGVVNISGLQAGYLFLGTLFAEVVFSWPGVGTVIVAAVASRDYPVIQAIVLFSGAIFACITLLVDLAMRALDPRVGA
jgi:peptide/nickel transport system permease protein